MLERGRTRADTNGELLAAMTANDARAFGRLLRITSGDLNAELAEPVSGTWLGACCKRPDRQALVAELLSAGADVNHLDGAGKAAVHYAAGDGNANALRVLLECPRTDVDAPDRDKNTALYLATRAGHVECARLLLGSKRVDPNRVNSEGKSPAYAAAASEERRDDLMRLFIKCPKVDLDDVFLGKPLRELITKNYPHFTEKKHEDPIDYLKSKDIEGFVWYVSFTRRPDRSDGKDVEHTYLQYACDVGLPEVVKALLDLGADPNKTAHGNDHYPVFIASFKGYAEIIKLFLESEKYVIFHSARGSVLHQVLKGWSESPDRSDVNDVLCNYEMSFNTLLDLCEYDWCRTPKIDINWVDGDGYTCLNVAVKSGKKKTIFALLDHNAYVGGMNACRYRLLDEINPGVLESYLDSCITSEQTASNVNYDINLSYKFLCPPMVFAHRDVIYGRVCYESQTETVVLQKAKETDPLLYMSGIPALKPLLVHPVISSFVFLKWHRIKLFFYINFLMYLFFLIILSFFILFHYKSVLSLQTYGLGWLVVLFGNLGMCFGELFQIINSPVKYIVDFQHWTKMLMIVLIYCLLFDILNDGLRIQASAIVFLISWGEILFFIGRHPVQAINLEILKIVTVNFLKFFIWFATLIIAFILCFYMLFRYKKHSSVPDILEQISLMTFETILMLTGEFSIKDEEFNLYPYAIVSRILFVLFIFLINIVLINLLCGLAVSDIQEIKNVSKIIAMASNVQFVNDFETILLGRNAISYIFSLCVKLKLCSKLELFPDALKKPYLTINSNQNFNEIIAKAVLDGVYLDNEDIIKATSLCNSKRGKSKESKRTDVYEKLYSIEKSMKEIKKMLKDMD